MSPFIIKTLDLWEELGALRGENETLDDIMVVMP